MGQGNKTLLSVYKGKRSGRPGHYTTGLVGVYPGEWEGVRDRDNDGNETLTFPQIFGRQEGPLYDWEKRGPCDYVETGRLKKSVTRSPDRPVNTFGLKKTKQNHPLRSMKSRPL